MPRCAAKRDGEIVELHGMTILAKPHVAGEVTVAMLLLCQLQIETQTIVVERRGAGGVLERLTEQREERTPTVDLNLAASWIRRGYGGVVVAHQRERPRAVGVELID